MHNLNRKEKKRRGHTPTQGYSSVETCCALQCSLIFLFYSPPRPPPPFCYFFISCFPLYFPLLLCCCCCTPRQTVSPSFPYFPSLHTSGRVQDSLSFLLHRTCLGLLFLFVCFHSCRIRVATIALFSSRGFFKLRFSSLLTTSFVVVYDVSPHQRRKHVDAEDRECAESNKSFFIR